MSNQLSEETVDALLDKLSSDDDFRDSFQKNPRRALASLGHGPSADAKVQSGAWSCMTVSRLASKDSIKASRDTLRKQLLSAQAAAHPISLETSRS
jgi:putative modified peptide